MSSCSGVSPGIYADATHIDEVRDAVEFIVGDISFAGGGVRICVIPCCVSRQNAAP